MTGFGWSDTVWICTRTHPEQRGERERIDCMEQAFQVGKTHQSVSRVTGMCILLYVCVWTWLVFVRKGYDLREERTKSTGIDEEQNLQVLYLCDK